MNVCSKYREDTSLIRRRKSFTVRFVKSKYGKVIGAKV
jgi:hypothetical protein